MLGQRASSSLTRRDVNRTTPHGGGALQRPLAAARPPPQRCGAAAPSLARVNAAAVLLPRRHRAVRAAAATDSSSSGDSGDGDADTAAVAPGVWDMVEFREEPGGRLRLGVVADVVAAASPSGRSGAGSGAAAVAAGSAAAQPPVLLVEPLVMEEEGVWAVDDADADGDGARRVALAAVVRTVDYDLQSRQDPVGPGNPHGEHAHDVYLPLGPLAPGVWRGGGGGGGSEDQ